MTTETMLPFPRHCRLDLGGDGNIAAVVSTGSTDGHGRGDGSHRVTSDDDSTSTLGIRDLAGLGGLNLACLVAGLAFGWFVDDRLGTTPVFTLIGLALGITAGIWGSWLRIRHFLHS